MVCGENTAQLPPPNASTVILAKDSIAFPDPCQNFAFPPPPPGDRRRIGPRRKYKTHLFQTWILFVIWSHAFVFYLLL